MINNNRIGVTGVSKSGSLEASGIFIDGGGPGAFGGEGADVQLVDDRAGELNPVHVPPASVSRYRLSTESGSAACWASYGANGRQQVAPIRHARNVIVSGEDRASKGFTAELLEVIRGTWRARTDRYSEQREALRD